MIRPLLQLIKVSRDFGSASSATKAIADASLEVYEGEFVAIMGPSGAGKSTLMNILGLLDTPTAGTYLIDGVPATGLGEKERNRLRANTFGFIFQAAHMLPHESAVQNVALALSIARRPRKHRNEAVAASLRDVGLIHRSNSTARTLSGGEKQRLAIARALVTEPPIILADEPTGNLDSKNTREVLAIFEQLHRSGKTIILITHDENVAKVADRRVILTDGVLLPEIGQRQNARQSTTALTSLRQQVQPLSPFERVGQALSGLTSRPFRSLMLVFAFLLGTGGLVASTGLAATASIQISSRLAEGALDRLTLFVPPGGTDSDRLAQLARIESIPHVLGAAEFKPIERVDAEVSRPIDENPISPPQFSGYSAATGSDYLTQFGATVSPARAAAELDTTAQGNVAIIGRDAAAQLGYAPEQIGYQLWILGRLHLVVGVIQDGGADEQLLNSIIVPIGNVQDTPTQVRIRTEIGYPAAVAEAVPLSIDPINPDAVEISTVADLRNLSIGVTSDLATLVGLTAVVVLVMAMLSAGTAMFLSVQSRAQEIALRRAIGSSRLSIYFNFMIEGALVGVAGGISGLASGLVGVVVVSEFQGWTVALPPELLAVGVISGLLAGILSAIIPAFSAARIEPAQAIR